MRNIDRLLELLVAEGAALPELARRMLAVLADQLRDAAGRVAVVERELMAWHRANEVSRRLATIPGVGPITASAIVATVGEATQFKSGRQFAAWLGLVPQQRSSGGKERLGRISKRGDGYIRRLMIHGARAVVGWHPASGWGLLLRAIMEISAPAISLADRPQRAIRVASVRERREDRSSISSHPLADLGGKSGYVSVGSILR
jgi:transposase